MCPVIKNANQIGSNKAAELADGINESERGCRCRFTRERRDGFAEVPIKGQHFFRAGRANQWRDVLTRAQAERIVTRHREQMARFRYVPAGY